MTHRHRTLDDWENRQETKRLTNFIIAWIFIILCSFVVFLVLLEKIGFLPEGNKLLILFIIYTIPIVYLIYTYLYPIVFHDEIK